MFKIYIHQKRANNVLLKIPYFHIFSNFLTFKVCYLIIHTFILFFLFHYYYFINDLIKFVYHSSKYAKLSPCDEIFVKNLE